MKNHQTLEEEATPYSQEHENAFQVALFVSIKLLERYHADPSNPSVDVIEDRAAWEEDLAVRLLRTGNMHSLSADGVEALATQLQASVITSFKPVKPMFADGYVLRIEEVNLAAIPAVVQEWKAQQGKEVFVNPAQVVRFPSRMI